MQKSIVTNSLWDFLVEVEKAFKEGYTLSDKNSHFPQAYINLYSATLIKEQKEELVAEFTTNVVTTDISDAAEDNPTEPNTISEQLEEALKGASQAAIQPPDDIEKPRKGRPRR